MTAEQGKPHEISKECGRYICMEVDALLWFTLSLERELKYEDASVFVVQPLTKLIIWYMLAPQTTNPQGGR